jgi:hypothetical protein
LAIARIRRALDQGVGAQRRILLSLAPSVQRELMFHERSQSAFFRTDSSGRPRDAPSFNGFNLLELPTKLRWENRGSVFSAPDSVVGE